MDLQRTFVVVAPMDSRNSRAMWRSSPSRTKLRLRKSISISLEMALMTCHSIEAHFKSLLAGASDEETWAV